MTVADVKSYVREDTVITVIEIPLITSEEFSINKVYPLPIRYAENDTYYYLETTMELVVVNYEHRNYIRMREADLRNCKRIGEHYLYHLTRFTNSVGIGSPCEIPILLKLDLLLSQCPERIVEVNEAIVVVLQRPGTWLYIAPESKEITVACKGLPAAHETLIGTGTIALNEKCALTAKDFRMATLRPYQSEQEFGYLPPYNP